MASKFSMVNTSGLFDTAAHVEASDRMQGAMEELKVKNDRQQRAAERQRAADESRAKQQTQRLARARENARANAAKSDAAYVRARKPNENQDDEEDDDDEDSDSEFSDDGYGLPEAMLRGAKLSGDDEDDDDALLDELDMDPELERLRARRLAQLKTQFEQKQALLAKGHGELREISQDEFLKEVTSSALVLVHFYHRDFERCKIMDMHLARLAKSHIECKFLKLNAEKAPFFVEKLVVRVLPTVIGFQDGVAFPQRVIGFDGLTDDDDDDEREDGGGAFGSRLNYRAKSSDSFPTAALARKLEEIGVITHNEADEDEAADA